MRGQNNPSAQEIKPRCPFCNANTLVATEGVAPIKIPYCGNCGAVLGAVVPFTMQTILRGDKGEFMPPPALSWWIRRPWPNDK